MATPLDLPLALPLLVDSVATLLVVPSGEVATATITTGIMEDSVDLLLEALEVNPALPMDLVPMADLPFHLPSPRVLDPGLHLLAMGPHKEL